MVTQLYTKNIEGDYEKVNWKLLKVVPIYKLILVIKDFKKLKRIRMESYKDLLSIDSATANSYLLQAEDIQYCINIIKKIRG